MRISIKRINLLRFWEFNESVSQSPFGTVSGTILCACYYFKLLFNNCFKNGDGPSLRLASSSYKPLLPPWLSWFCLTSSTLAFFSDLVISCSISRTIISPSNLSVQMQKRRQEAVLRGGEHHEVISLLSHQPGWILPGSMKYLPSLCADWVHHKSQDKHLWF